MGFKEHMDFGEAIVEVLKGKRIQREGWDGKLQYVELASNISYVNPKGEVINTTHINTGNRAIVFGNKALAFVGTSGVQLGWLASQADMFAKDWKTVEE